VPRGRRCRSVPVVGPERLLIERCRKLAETGLRFSESVMRDRVVRAGPATATGPALLQHLLAEHGPVIYDCLEFGPIAPLRRCRREIAFLSMDLTARGRADIAERSISQYLAVTDDAEAGSLVPMFALHFAMVRAR